MTSDKMSHPAHDPGAGDLSGNDLLGFERFLSELSASFVRAAGAEVDLLVREGLQRIVTFLTIERCTLTEVVVDRRETYVRYSVAKEGHAAIPPMRADLLFPWTTGRLLQNEVVVLFHPYSYPPEAEIDRKNAELGGFKSSIHIPIVVEGAVRYILSAASLCERRIWPEVLVPRLRLLGEVLANALVRTSREEEIRALKDALEAENLSLREVVNAPEEYADIVGRSDALASVLNRMEQVARTDATVLLLGETGVGKELFARAIHRLSGRSEKTMLKVDCASLAPSLIESELFGHERGAFTGAVGMRKGRFELASGGTVFLDEVAELPLEQQAKLLRVLEEGMIERVGSARPVKVNVRIIAATNRDLDADMKSGRFRQDLYFRLSTFPIIIPPLREREGDVPLLVDHFVRLYSARYAKPVPRITAETSAMLTAYSWPGNVRELENVIESAVIASRNQVLEVPPLTVRKGMPADTDPLRPLADVEREHILRVLNQTFWRIEGPSGAASILDLHPDTLRHRMKKFGIRRPGPRR